MPVLGRPSNQPRPRPPFKPSFPILNRQAQLYCVLCKSNADIPVNCGDPAQIKVAAGYYRPDGLDPAVSIASSDDTYDLTVAPVMAVACPWGKQSCAGGALHGNASCVLGHHGLFCAECLTEWYRGSSDCRECPQNAASAIAVYTLLVTLGSIGERAPHRTHRTRPSTRSHHCSHALDRRLNAGSIRQASSSGGSTCALPRPPPLARTSSSATAARLWRA